LTASGLGETKKAAPFLERGAAFLLSPAVLMAGGLRKEDREGP
jgi:hypothetical protein